MKDTAKLLGIIAIIAMLNIATIYISRPAQVGESLPDARTVGFGPGVGTNQSIAMTLYLAETPTEVGGFRLGYNITNLGEELVWMQLPARGKNFNIHVLTPGNTEIKIVPLIDSKVIDGPVQPGSSQRGYIILENNENQKWSEGEDGEPYPFPAGQYLAYAVFMNGEAYSELIEFDVIPAY